MVCLSLTYDHKLADVWLLSRMLTVSLQERRTTRSTTLPLILHPAARHLGHLSARQHICCTPPRLAETPVAQMGSFRYVLAIVQSMSR